MNQRTDATSDGPQRTTRHSMSLFHLFGIEVRLDISVAIIFLLIVFSLGSGIFPQWHPTWSPAMIWGTALASGILFFISLLAHELSHSVVSQHYGIPVPRITLFLFGGMAEPSREPDRPKVEFLVAAAGPLMSIVISLICTNLALWLAEDGALVDALAGGEPDALASIGPVTTALLWLGSINMVLALFNLIPGFPMDGGRVFRAIIWAITGDHFKATRWASNGGRYFGWTLMALGVLGLFGGAGLGALWWILIGWFISGLAGMSYRQTVMDRALRGFDVEDLMRTHFEEVDPAMPLPAFVDECLLRSSQQVWPVVEQGQLRGIVTLSDVRDLSEDRRRELRVADVMRDLGDVHHLEATAHAGDAFMRLARSEDETLPVMRDGKVVGLIQRGDILRWMSLHDLYNRE